MRSACKIIVTTIGLVAILVARAPAAVSDFELADRSGQHFRSADSRGPALAVVFLGTECPLAKLYADRLNALAMKYREVGVGFVAVDSNDQDTAEQIEQFARSQKLVFPMMRDRAGEVARRLGATRSPEVVLLNAAREIVYRGRIDDQYEPGARRPQPTREDLRAAIDDVLAGRPVAIPETRAVGCFLNIPRTATSLADIGFQQVAPILQKHCVECHRPEQIAPFSLITEAEVRPWAETIREVIDQDRMPPWGADPQYGHFVNERRLTDGERKTLFAWIDAASSSVATVGSPSSDLSTGNAHSLLGKPAAAPVDEIPWSIGTPDLVLSIPKPMQILATGVMEYQYVTVDPQFEKDQWVSGYEIRPGNRAALHHCTVFLTPPGSEAIAESGSLGSACLATYVPGTTPQVLPPGVAKRIPAGWRLLFVLHYVPTGVPQEDRTSLGLRFIDASAVHKELATKVLIDDQLKIPPRDADYVVEKTWRADADMLLYAMFPHMHLRGKSFRYDLEYRDGQRETLLYVPKYDFNWQHRYVLAEPKLLPVGSTLHCTAHYDNSSANPNNPDPNATVVTGQQSTDEMFNGYFDIALADKDLVAERRTRHIWPAIVAIAGVLLSSILLVSRLRGGTSRLC